MRLRAQLPLALFAGLAGLLFTGLGLKPHLVPSPFIGKPAPPFALASLHDASRTITPADLGGRAWVLNVWASWCGPCRDEHALLLEVAAQAQAPLVGLNYKDDPRHAQEWLLKLGNPYVATALDHDGRAAIDWGVYGVPETFVIDRAGVVRLKHVGPMTREVWQREVAPLLSRLDG